MLQPLDLMKKAEFVKKLGLTIRKARQNKEYSIEELADRCDISYSTLSCLERGVVGDIKAYNLYNIIKILDIDPGLIFDGHRLTREKINLINKIYHFDDKELRAFLELFRKII